MLCEIKVKHNIRDFECQVEKDVYIYNFKQDDQESPNKKMTLEPKFKSNEGINPAFME